MDISIDNLTKNYAKGVKALDSLTLSIPTGMFGLLGPNGAGKTTLMRILATLLAPSSGTVLINGYNARSQARSVRQILGYLPQYFNGYGNLTIYEYLDYMAVLKGLSHLHRKARVQETMEQVNLANHHRTKIRHLSGGMKRRMGIAQTLLNKPLLLIVDEPTAGLDPEERVRFRNLLTQLSTGRVVLLSTHIVEDIAGTCSNIAVLHKGQLLTYCSPDALVAKSSGKVWEYVVPTNCIEPPGRECTLVTSVQTNSGVRVRVVAENRPTSAAASVQPTLEDAYLYLMQEVAQA